ncbi:mRNA export protein mlo3 [Vanrija pseudolonga]|uniref:mRNA export protein mlo3 n=1 Tax=Vanrija pseudolonga TaxID=143232 RepID=A0AAF0XZI6_9TREE|nr:mRNA export protein mlo3 [Vanrija pseudolonga]
MASMDIDKPLDELIASKPRGRRGGGRGPRGAGGRAEGGAAPAAGGARARYAGAAPKTGSQVARGAAAPPAKGGKPLTAEATKIIISNLPADVTEAAVRDLLQSTVGPVRSVHLSYNSSGKSNGVATILFKNKGDANKAHATYNNRMIDNR